MTSRQEGRRKYRGGRKQEIEEKRAEGSLFPDKKRVTSKLKSQGISLNDLVQLHSPIRHGWVRYIGEIANLDRHCDFFLIELKANYRKMGTHNGTFRGIRYFPAPDKSGVLCKRDRIQKVLKRSALPELQTALYKLSKTEEKKLLIFAKSVKRLTGLLSIGHVTGLDLSFERARKRSGFTIGTSPFTSRNINGNKCSVSFGGPLQKIVSGVPRETSPASSYSCASDEEETVRLVLPEGDEKEQAEISGVDSGSK